MKKSMRKGFTLVELLVTIVLLGVIGAVVIYNMTSVTTTSKETDYDRYITTIRSAANVYADLNEDAFHELYVSKSYIYITIGQLIEAGLLDDTLTNPYTGKVINPDEVIKVNLDTTNGDVVVEYPVEDKKEESFLLSMSDYVVWGETYDCMQGAGTYELAISKENGDLIMLNSETINKYDFKCSFPSEFGVTGTKGRTDKAGTYDIEYTWVTESGTRKKSTRTLRVLDQIKPSFKLNKSGYNSKDPNVGFYRAAYNTSNGTWDQLKYVPYIEGADPSTTVVSIYKKSNVGNGAWQTVVEGKILSTFNETAVDDGDKTYRIVSTIKGHYDPNYSYTAEDRAYVKSELEIPAALIKSLTSEACTTNRDFQIMNNLNSLVGVHHYEYKLSNSNKTPDKNTEQISSYIFETNNAQGNANCAADGKQCVVKNVSVLAGGRCPDEIKEYKYIYFRAVNNDGYAGIWTRVDTLISNSLECILPAKAYTQNELFIKYHNTNFVALEVFEDGSMYATNTDKNGTGLAVRPTKVETGYAEQVTCDMTVYKYYDYSSPVVDRITKELTRWLEDNNLPYTKLVNKSYNLGGFKRNLYATTFAKSGGTFNYDDYNGMLYKGYGDFWTTTSYYSPFTVYLDQPHKHANESTTAYNGFFYYTNGNGLAGQKYVGQEAYVKPIVKFTNMYVCSGDGKSEETAYVIGL